MPIKPGKFFAAPPPTPDDEAPSFFQRVRDLAGLGTRAVTGVLASEGWLPGAAIAGAGELGAELIEGSQPSWKRVAAEAGLGFVPFGAVFKAGRPLATAARGAAFGASGSALRQLAEKGEVDPLAAAESGAIGGALTGGLAKLLSPKTTAATQKATTFSEKAAPIIGEEGGTYQYRLPKPPPGPPSRVPSPREQGVFAQDLRKILEKRVEEAPGAPEQLSELDKAIASTKKEAVKTRAANFRAETSGQIRENAADLARMKESIKLAEEATSSRKAELAKLGLEEKEPTVVETLSSKVPGAAGTTKVTRKWAPKAAEKAATKAEVTVMDEEGNLTAPATEQAIEPIAPTAEAVPSAIAKFFKTRKGATGTNYRLAQKAAEAGEIPSAEFAREAHLRSLSETPRAATQAAEAEVPEWVTHQSGIVDKLKKLSEESGGVDPALLARLGLGAGGALAGAAYDKEDPLRGALAGGVAGFAAPSLPGVLREMGAHPSIVGNLGDRVASEGIQATAKRVWESLPQIQRFNYLSHPSGLLANMWFGPYGSALMAGIEYSLSGDPRGIKLLGELKNPLNFVREFKAAQNLEESRQMIGRAEGSPFGEAAGLVQKGMALPGLAMTAGDNAARKILLRAGFTEEEARRITLTSEPELTLPKRIANFTKGSTLSATAAKLLMPFSRTPANIMEQGAERLPGLGFAVQSEREIPDSLRQQLVQQGLSLATGGVGYAAGESLDPETAKTARRFLTNLGGQYSLPTNIGFAMGQAAQKGKPILASGATAGLQDLPLPAVDTPVEWVKYLLGTGPLPRGATPGFVKTLTETQEVPKIKPLKLGKYRP